jgi:uncharacterized membrane protein
VASVHVPPAFGAAGPGSTYRLRTGLPGDVAFSASIICVQAWTVLLYGVVGIFGGSLLGKFGSSLGSNCSPWDSNCQSLSGSTSDVGRDAVIIGIVVLAVGLLLLIGVIDLMRGSEAGRTICAIAQMLILAFGVWLSVEAQSFIPAVALGIFPLFALLGLLGKPAVRLVRDSRAATIASDPPG